MKGHGEPSREKPHPEETHKIYLVEVFGIQEKVGDAQVLAKVASHHSEKQHPANHQHNVPSYIIKQKLYWK
jgi:hypothetical protein